MTYLCKGIPFPIKNKQATETQQHIQISESLFCIQEATQENMYLCFRLHDIQKEKKITHSETN